MNTNLIKALLNYQLKLHIKKREIQINKIKLSKE